MKIDKVWATDINFWFGAPRDVTFELNDGGTVGKESRDATAMDSRVLSYGPVVLHHQDVDLLKGPHFLNDQIIEFYFHYLSQHNTAASAAEGTDKPAPLLLVGPSLAFWLLHCPDADGRKASVDPLHLPEREVPSKLRVMPRVSCFVSPQLAQTRIVLAPRCGACCQRTN